MLRLGFTYKTSLKLEITAQHITLYKPLCKLKLAISELFWSSFSKRRLVLILSSEN